MALPSTNTRPRIRRSLLRIFVFMLFNFFIVLAFRDLSSLRTHFRPFTEVVRKSRRKVTRKLGEPRVTRMTRMEARFLEPMTRPTNHANRVPQITRLVVISGSTEAKFLPAKWREARRL